MLNLLKEDLLTEKSIDHKTRGIYLGILSSVKVSLLLVLLAFIYYPTFIWMWQRWFAADSYYAHGPLIPIVSFALFWNKRRELSQIPISSSKLGLGLLFTGLVLHILSALFRIYFTSAYSFFIVLLGLTLYLLGKKLTLAFIFPIFFLLFMIPAPIALVEASTLRMKFLTAHVSVFIIQILGIPVIREGSTVFMPNTNIVVGDPCSGLKSLISLSALAILYVYIVKASFFRKSLLFLISIPIALGANIIRTTATLIIANYYGDKIVTDGFLHQAFGLMVFVIAFAGLFLAGRILGCRLTQKGT